MSEPRRGRSPRAPTAKAVAEHAGVSVTTVSRVLSGRAEAIPEGTQQRVLAAARELGYRPNSLAVALRKGVTRTVGLLVPDIGDAYFHQVARGVEDVAQAAGYMVVFCNTDRVADKERACVELLRDKRVDGIVFAGGGIDEDRHLADTPWEGMHVITIGPHRLGFPAVRVDDAATIETATWHLLDEGCERILCIAGRRNWLVSEARLEGYRRALAAAGRDLDPELVVHGDFVHAAGYRAVEEAVSAGVDFDGVIAFNDYCAVGALEALHEAGRKVPDDVAVVGCDDLALASLVHPRLSSIAFSQYDFGRTAMQMILDLASGREIGDTTFPYHLEVRASSRRTGRA
ncbi:MAG: substrate-binding domain-containing protein [Streptosporangiales bacterium]|nr:substrate-binding domain-containing protein [Streptosporangiales bacterium]